MHDPTLPLYAEMKTIQTQAAKTLRKTRGRGSQEDTNPAGGQNPRVGCGLRNAPAVSGAGATPPPGTRSPGAAPLTWPLPGGGEEARQEQKHDTEEQLESHVCSQRRGAL